MPAAALPAAAALLFWLLLVDCAQTIRFWIASWPAGARYSGSVVKTLPNGGLPRLVTSLVTTSRTAGFVQHYTHCLDLWFLMLGPVLG